MAATPSIAVAQGRLFRPLAALSSGTAVGIGVALNPSAAWAVTVGAPAGTTDVAVGVAVVVAVGEASGTAVASVAVADGLGRMVAVAVAVVVAVLVGWLVGVLGAVVATAVCVGGSVGTVVAVFAGGLVGGGSVGCGGVVGGGGGGGSVGGGVVARAVGVGMVKFGSPATEGKPLPGAKKMVAARPANRMRMKARFVDIIALYRWRLGANFSAGPLYSNSRIIALSRSMNRSNWMDEAVTAVGAGQLCLKVAPGGRLTVRRSG